jgi:hypothetical protein
MSRYGVQAYRRKIKKIEVRRHPRRQVGIISMAFWLAIFRGEN